jgi:hypothetical protein
LEKEIRIMTPCGMLGYGIPKEWFWKGIDWKPDFMAVDAGSTDSGPQKLGNGDMTCTRDAYKTDLELMLKACYDHKIPTYISSAGGDGSDMHVDLFVDIIKEISQENGYHFNMAVIYANIDKDIIHSRLEAGRVKPLGPVPELTGEEIDAATVVVAQMGVEPYIKAIENSPKKLDIIVSGRTYDPVPIALPGLLAGFDPGLCWHIGKIMECGSKCAEPNGKVILGILREDGFILEPSNPEEFCVPSSVAAHTLYEKSHPYILPGPGGYLDLQNCSFDAVSERAVRVSGSKFVPTPYTVKLEGAKPIGYRTICVCGIRDPILISQIDDYLVEVEKTVASFIDLDQEGQQLLFHVYGKNGVMGPLEPDLDTVPKELCVILEAVAPTQAQANSICNKGRVAMLHLPYEGKICTGGNVALPFTPLELPIGVVCKFNIYHLMELDDPNEVFPIKYLEV